MFPFVQFRAESCLSSLIERGLDVNQPCQGQHGALDYALKIGHIETIGLLLEHIAVPRHPWLTVEEYARFSIQQWFPSLLKALSHSISDIDYEQSRGHVFDGGKNGILYYVSTVIVPSSHSCQSKLETTSIKCSFPQP